MYVVYEKSYIEKLGNRLEDEVNILDTDNIAELIKEMKEKQNVEIAKRTIYQAIKSGKPVFNKYYIYKIKEEEEVV